MQVHHYVAWFIVLTVPLSVGVVFAVESLKGRLRVWVALCVTPIAVLVSGVATFVLVARCVDSYEIVVAAKKLLTTSELETLSGRWFCPAAYRFQRDGRGECIAIIGGRAGIGCG